VALARPQLGYAWEESLTEGIDIQIALDVSGSMAAEDFVPENRLAVAKDVVRRFVAGRTGDRIGLTVFSGSAITRAPLTTDRRMLDLLVRSLEINTQMDGTAIGVALATAAASLQDSEAKSRVIVLVTDGVNNAGAIDPLSAAAVSDGLGIRVYTVGVGTAAGDGADAARQPGDRAHRDVPGDDGEPARRRAPAAHRRAHRRPDLPRHRRREPGRHLRRDRPPGADADRGQALRPLPGDLPTPRLGLAGPAAPAARRRRPAPDEP
jgi:Ca-activated chloride channel homolog